MSENICVSVYGDSLLKATMPDEALHYHFHLRQYLPPFEALPVALHNRACFGATVEKGAQLLAADLRRGQCAQLTLLEFGGNDCNYDWPAIAQSPAGHHPPATDLAAFCRTLADMVRSLQAADAHPVLMTLPPISGQKYFDFFSRGLDRAGLLQWLHGDVQRIYRTQELYSHAVLQLAGQLAVPCVDVRAAFLLRPDAEGLLAADGIHLNGAGYDLLFQTLYDALCGWLQKAPAA